MLIRIARHLAVAGQLSSEKKSRVDAFTGDGKDAGRMMVITHENSRLQG